LSENYQHLPIDTKYFKDLELEILSQFDNLDKSLDGWLIKSENYQALNTILPKFKEKVQTIYIDPPFNLDSSDQFLYRTNYKDANWATLLENRLKLAKDWLNKKGSIFVRCDYNGNWIVRCLMDEIFNSDNYLNEFIIKRITKKGFNANRYPTSSDYIYWYSKTEELFFNIIRLPTESGKERWHSMDSMSGGRGTGEARYILGKLRTPPKNRVWTFSQQRIFEMEKQGLIKLNSKGTPIYKVLLQDGEPLDSNWSDIQGYSFTTGFATENSEVLLSRVINTGSQKDDFVFDFFLGSGTTTAVAHKLGRNGLVWRWENIFIL
jgi:adenine specific DNA methylase Mod